MDVVTDAKKAMDGWHRGQTSASYETSNRGPGWISSGKGDHGGVSYGTYQFASAVGGVDEYLAGSRYGAEFRGLAPATQAFNDRWKEVADRDPGAFGRDQHTFIQHQYYDKQLARLKDAGVDLHGRGPAVQDALWSTSVQYRNMTRGVFVNGLKQAYGDGYKLSELSDEQIVRAVQDYKHDNVQRHFESSPTQWNALRERTLNEKADLVGLARYEQVSRHPQDFQGKTYEQAFGEPLHRARGSHAARPAMADGVLVQGEHGAEVQSLQQKLAQAGYTGKDGKALNPDGDFGGNTEHAVRQFQKAHGLEEDGKAGRDTLAALGAGTQTRAAADDRSHSPTPTPTPTQTSAPAAAAAAPGGGRITVVEPYGNVTSNRTLAHGMSGDEAYRLLKIHHPNTNAEAVRTGDASKADRQSGMVEGEMENIRTTGDKNGIPLVRKDLILTDRLANRDVMIPNPVAGYVEFLKDPTNGIRIYSHPAGDPRRELVGQVMHGAAGSSPYKNGDFVEYGAPLVKQSNAGTKAVHAHIELEPDQYRRYLGDMLNDRITLGGTVHAQGPAAAQAARSAQQAPMADGMLVKGERGDEVKALQGRLAALGYTAADGKALGADGIFGKDTLAAVKQFQANNGLDDDGKAGRLTLARLQDPAAVKAGAQTTAAPSRTEPVAPAAPASMRDAGHVENPRFNQALEKLQALQQQRTQAGLSPLFANAQETERAAGQLAYESKVAGMCQIDHVLARPDGTGLFAVQGNVGDPAAQRAFVDRQQAVSQSVEASTRQSAELDTQFSPQVQAQQEEQVKGRAL